MDNLSQGIAALSEIRRARRFRRPFFLHQEKCISILEEPEDIQCTVKTSGLCLPVKFPTQTTADDCASWQLSKTISGHSGCVTCVAVDPRNQWFATGSSDRAIKIWDLESDELRLSFHAHEGSVRAIAMSARFPFLYTCGDDGKPKCWNLDYVKLVRTYRNELCGVKTLALHPFYDCLITAGKDCSILVWDIRTKDVMNTLRGHTSAVTKILAPSFDNQIITASNDATIRIWDIVAGKAMHTLKKHHMKVCDLVFDPKRNTFISGGPDSIKQWQFPDGSFIQTLGGKEAFTDCLAVSSQDLLVSGNILGTLNFWNANANSEPLGGFRKHSGSVESGCSVTSMAFDHLGSKLIATGTDANIKIFEKR